MNTSETVLKIISSHSKRKDLDITPETPLASLAIDSLGMVEILFEIEEQFDIEIPESGSISERFETFKTPKDIVRAVDELMLSKT